MTSRSFQFIRNCRKIVCVGRNYAEHAKELGNAVPSKPVLFLKPTSSFLQEGKGAIEVPHECKEIHHEVELGVIIGKAGRDIPASKAMQHVGGYFLALDMTARNLQNEAKKGGLPWSISKGYDTFCPVSPQIAVDQIKDPQNVNLWLKVDNQLRQKGNTKDMLFSIPTLISYISTVFRLEDGDCILTGTPEGVGPVAPGQVVTAGLSNGGDSSDVLQIKFSAVKRPLAKL